MLLVEQKRSRRELRSMSLRPALHSMPTHIPSETASALQVLTEHSMPMIFNSSATKTVQLSLQEGNNSHGTHADELSMLV